MILMDASYREPRNSTKYPHKTKMLDPKGAILLLQPDTQTISHLEVFLSRA
jgi:hypothetical protein